MNAGHMARPHFAEAFRAFLKIGLLSFGGPAAQIALMHRVLVEEKAWLSERQFLNALSFCMLLPGPEAMQLATYAGWRLHGVLGGFVAGLLFVLPGAAVVLGLATIYAYLGDVPLVGALFLGVKAAVLAIVVDALLKVAKRALKGPAQWAIAGLAFVGIFFLALPFPLIVFAAALYGALFARAADGQDVATTAARVPIARTIRTVALGLVVWLLPVAAFAVGLGPEIVGDVGLFFSKLAVVTFGGAYAVLAYMAQDVVTGYGWLTAGEMLDGLGLAETTPGPLILVTEFVGFLAAFRAGGLWLGLAGAAMTLWATFAPCFLWIFAGAPYVERIAEAPRLAGALQAITAAVVGVILNLSLWFALHVLFAEVVREQAGPFVLWRPDVATLDWRVLVLGALAALLLFWRRWGVAQVLGVSAALGLALSYV